MSGGRSQGLSCRIRKVLTGRRGFHLREFVHTCLEIALADLSAPVSIPTRLPAGSSYRTRRLPKAFLHRCADLVPIPAESPGGVHEPLDDLGLEHGRDLATGEQDVAAPVPDRRQASFHLAFACRPASPWARYARTHAPSVLKSTPNSRASCSTGKPSSRHDGTALRRSSYG